MESASSRAPWPFFPNRGPRISGGDGVWLICDDGRRILDAAGGAIAANIGHGRQEVVDAMSKATPAYVAPVWRTPERDALVEQLESRWLAPHLTHQHFTCGGAEANETAVKLALLHFVARGQPERNVILAREVSYHGTTLGMAAISGHAARRNGLENFLDSHPKIPTATPLHCPLGAHHPDAAQHFLAETRDRIEALGGERIAALLIEPITGASGGAIVPPDGYLEGIRALADEYGFLIIADEVMTGFGRIGHQFATDCWDLRPEILVAGKGLAAGYAALTGVYASDATAEPLAGAGYDLMFHTYAALPAACAAASSVLEILEREQLVENAKLLGEHLATRLHKQLGAHPNVAEIRGMGLLQAVELVQDRDSLTPFPANTRLTHKIVAQGIKHDVYFYPGGTGVVRDIICLGPPLTSSRAELDQMADVLTQSISEVLASQPAREFYSN